MDGLRNAQRQYDREMPDEFLPERDQEFDRGDRKPRPDEYVMRSSTYINIAEVMEILNRK